MKRNGYFPILALCAVVSIILFYVAPALAVAEVSITGTVYAEEWDNRDNVTEVVIETADGELYYVSNDGRGKELLKLVEKNVRVSGIVEDAGGEKVITVKKYEILK